MVKCLHFSWFQLKPSLNQENVYRLKRVCLKLLGSMVSLVTTQVAHSTMSNSMLRQLFVQGAPPTASVRSLHVYAHPGQFQISNVQRQLKVQELIVVLYNVAIPTGNKTPNLSHYLSNRHAPRLTLFLSMIHLEPSSAEAQAPQIPSDTTWPSVQADRG